MLCVSFTISWNVPLCENVGLSHRLRNDSTGSQTPQFNMSTVAPQWPNNRDKRTAVVLKLKDKRKSKINLEVLKMRNK